MADRPSMDSPWSLARSRPRRPGAPGLSFLLLLGVFSGTGAALAHGVAPGRFSVIVFVLSGWVVSVCLHEFGHALVAYWGGDRGVADSGYLELDPASYAEPVLSLLLPVVFIALGGFGLPGGAVWINTSRLRGRLWVMASAAAGPAMTLLCLALLGWLFATLPDDGPGDIEAAVAVLAYFQATALILNLLPLPGLDGFGIIRPLLRRPLAARIEALGAGPFLILALILWLTPAGASLSRAALSLAVAFGFDVVSVARGFSMIRLV